MCPHADPAIRSTLPPPRNAAVTRIPSSVSAVNSPLLECWRGCSNFGVGDIGTSNFVMCEQFDSLAKSKANPFQKKFFFCFEVVSRGSSELPHDVVILMWNHHKVGYGKGSGDEEKDL